jgi:amino acid adenylation domain-containing protein
MAQHWVFPEQRELFTPTPEVAHFAGVHRLIAERAAQNPKAPALVCAGRSLSYSELEVRSAALARRLRALGVGGGGPETVVGVYLERSPEALVAMLGILRAGGTYLPLDPLYPRERLTFMLEDSGAAVLVTREGLRAELPSASPLVVCLDGVGEGSSVSAAGAAGIDAVDPSGLAYILYTSGSSGRPKGVGISHAALLHHAQAMVRAYRLVPRDRVLQFASLSFDVAAEEVYPSLLAGAAVVLLPDPRAAAPEALAGFIEREGVTVVNLPSPYWHEWVDALAASGERLPDGLRLVVVGSDRVAPEKLAVWSDLVEERGSLAEWANAYGLTESTITSTLFRLPWRRGGVQLSPVPIGQPVGETSVYVLDAAGEPVSDGMAGELWLGGPGLARGYLGRPDLTADRFRPDPAVTLRHGEPGARLLRTGDLARFRPDGHLELLGRADSQIKIRGFRLEPGEIETALCAHPAVDQAVVTVRELREADNDRLLAACLVASPGVPAPPVHELREWLLASLPEPMVPAAFIFMDRLPLTPSGKVDRLALARIDLAAMGAAARDAEEYAAPRTPVEEVLAGLWASLLKVERVGARDDFFHLGGHSLLAGQLVARVRDLFGIDLPVRAVFAAPTLEGLARRIEEARHASEPPLAPQPRVAGEPSRASFAQQRLWVIDQLQPGSALYNVPAYFRIRGTPGTGGGTPLDAGALAAALDEVVRRHEALRTVFVIAAGEPMQVLEPYWPLGAARLPQVDLSGLPRGRRRGEEARLAAGEAARPFNLARGPLLRGALVRLDETEHALLLNIHHIVSDGWSIGVLAGELTALYQGVRLPEPALQYADFSDWQRRWLTGEVLEGQLVYWRERLAGLAPLELPADRPRPPVQSFRGAAVRLDLAPELTAGLERASRGQGATLFMTLLAGFQALLGRYSGQDDLGVGTPIAGRNRQEIEGLIGFFVNTLVLRADLAGRPGFAELVARVRATALGAYAHQDLPFDRLVEDLAPQRNLSRNPLFQVAFALQNVPMPDLGLGPGLAMEAEDSPVSTSKFDLSLFIQEERGGLTAVLEYCTDLFEAETARRLLGHFRALLEAALDAPAVPFDELPMLAEAERLELLVDRNRTRREFPRDIPVHRLFEEQARISPEAVAVIAGAERLTYDQLNRRANRLAHRLRSLGVGPDTPVAVVLERSVEMVAALLAVLKAGGAYVPLDPRDPADRLAFVLDDTAASVVIGRPAEMVAAGLAPCEERALFCVDVDGAETMQLPGSWNSDMAVEVDAANLAYIIFTSGSTGRPKGVAVPHGAINRLVIHTDYAQLGPGDRVGHLSNPAFDAAVFEVWGALLTGASLVVVPRDVALSPTALGDALVRERITALFLTTALFNQMAREAPRSLSGLRHLLFGGEAVDPNWVRASLASPPERLLHVYGPTESTTFTTWHEVREAPEGAVVPIGKPIANTSVFVLDARFEPVPSGVHGELCIGGEGLARGYWNRPDLTAERFVPDPAAGLTSEPGARLYRSGDRVRQRRDGAVEFVGRIDHQVKIRGFRIEPGEIETALAAHPEVAGALVMAREDLPGDRRLVAYVVPHAGAAPETRDLRAFLGDRLPCYMVPCRFVLLEKFPLNANGKVDRRALPPPDLSRPEQEAAYIGPRTPLEERIAESWSMVLGVDRVGIHDNFWELGGHSLLATKVLSRLYDDLGVELPLQALFEAPTLSGFAVMVGQNMLAASGEEGQRLLDELSEMSEEEVLSLLAEGW